MIHDPIIPQTSSEQAVQHEQQKVESSGYWQKVSEFYGKVYDGMEYTAYIASGHDPAVVMVKVSSFVNRHKFLFVIIGSMGLISYLFRIYVLVR